MVGCGCLWGRRLKRKFSGLANWKEPTQKYPLSLIRIWGGGRWSAEPPRPSSSPWCLRPVNPGHSSSMIPGPPQFSLPRRTKMTIYRPLCKAGWTAGWEGHAPSGQTTPRAVAAKVAPYTTTTRTRLCRHDRRINTVLKLWFMDFLFIIKK